MSVALLTPQKTSWVYEAPKKILAEVVIDANTTSIESVSIYNSEFNWRGEIFLTMGMYCNY